jgi:phosphopantetheinyl transferase
MFHIERKALFSLDMPLPAPMGGTAPVWLLLIPSDVSRCKGRELFTLLDEGERKRSWEIRAAERHASFIAGHGWRRVLLSAIVNGVPPAAWRFSTGEHGRPLLAVGGGLYDTSLSYAAGVTAVAVSAGCRVGVDIEVADGLPGERWGKKKPGTGESRGVNERISLRDWTLAEAVGKCLGQGLPDAFEVRHATGPPGGAARVSLFRRLVLLGDLKLHVAIAAAPLAEPPG